MDWFPRNDTDPLSGWTIDPAYLMKIRAIVDHNADGFTASLEAIESVLLAVEDLEK